MSPIYGWPMRETVRSIYRGKPNEVTNPCTLQRPREASVLHGRDPPTRMLGTGTECIYRRNSFGCQGELRQQTEFHQPSGNDIQTFMGW